MIPIDIKINLLKVSQYCKDHTMDGSCYGCELEDFCYDVFDISPQNWGRKLLEDDMKE